MNEAKPDPKIQEPKWKKIMIIVLKVLFFPIYLSYKGIQISKEVFDAGKPYKDITTNVADPDMIKKFFFVWIFYGGLIGLIIDIIISAAMTLNKDKDEDVKKSQILNETFWKLFFPCLFLGIVLGILITMSKTFNIPMAAFLYPFFLMVIIFIMYSNIFIGIGVASLGIIGEIIKNAIILWRESKSKSSSS